MLGHPMLWGHAMACPYGITIGHRPHLADNHHFAITGENAFGISGIKRNFLRWGS
jgi:hypothetical protein